MITKTINDIISDIVAYINIRNSSIDTAIGRVIRDISIDAPASELVKLYSIYEYLSKAQSIEGFKSILNTPDLQTTYAAAFGDTLADFIKRLKTDIDVLVGNWGITRKAATKSVGIARFKGTRNDISVSIPIETVISTATSPAVNFVTTSAYTGFLINYESITGLYYVELPIIALEAGEASNKIANSITVLNSVIPNLIAVSNPLATSGGEDEEQDSVLLDRASISWIGRDIGTIYGYKSFLMSQEGIRDAFVVGPTHPLMTRSIIGAIDIYCLLTSKLQVATQKFSYSNDNFGDKIILDKQPVDSIISIIDANSTTYSIGVDFIFVKDTSAFAESCKARDYISFFSGHEPPIGLTFTITFMYDSKVEETQNLLDSIENKLISSDVLLKRAAIFNIDLKIRIVIYSGYDLTVVQANITSALSNFFNTLLLGQDIEISDVLTTITSVEGVDMLDTSVFELNSQKISAIPGGILSVADNAHTKLNSIIWL